MRKVVLTIAIGVLLVACQKEKSLSGFIAENGNKPGFKTLSLTTDALSIRESETDEDIKSALKAVGSIQFISYSAKERPTGEMGQFVDDLLVIIEDKRFESLMEMTSNGQFFRISARKSGDVFKEMILFGRGEDSFFIGRILGEMKEEQGIKLMEAIDFSMIGNSQISF